MLIRFTVENFRSFNGEAVFSMIPGRSRQHSNHIISNAESGIDTLRASLLYGANASGKSNLVKAMSFARNLIVEGSRPKQKIFFQPFRLQKERDKELSRFEFEFSVGNQTFAYGFELSNEKVHNEWLYLINSKVDTPLFERETDKQGLAIAQFAKSSMSSNFKESQFFDFVARGTRPNQLLLTEMIEQNAGGVFELVYEWFRTKFIIIFPNTRIHGIQLGIYTNQNFSAALANFLNTMNTGIDKVYLKPIDEPADVPLNVIDDALVELNANDNLVSDQTDEQQFAMIDGSNGQRYLVLKNGSSNSPKFYALFTQRIVDGDLIDFNMIDESDGTQRLLDLFPILYASHGSVFVIDELERSLHPNLVRLFIENFLKSNNHNQLVVTTHESTLIDLDLLRRDEIWFVEKNPQGASTLYSLEEFKIRPDLDARKGYLQGRFGAIPVFGSSLLQPVVED